MLLYNAEHTDLKSRYLKGLFFHKAVWINEEILGK
jgi:hypothetical protein